MNPNGRASGRELVAIEAARAGGMVARESFRSEIEVETKSSKTDLVTRADRDAQRTVGDRIRASYPDEPIVGEEDDELTALPETGSAWIVDPIDGTANFVRGISTFATAVAAVADGEPVASSLVFPALGDAYAAGPDGAWRDGERLAVSERDDPEVCAVCPTLWWGRDGREEYARACREIVERFGDLRRFGCAQAELAMVASGALDATLTNVEANPWDTVAGVQLIRAAGGTVTDLEGDRWRHDSTGLVASNGRIHDEALAAARAICE
ncbi:inositol monophosphatase [Halovivax sp.]|uniref:inositol monophosphatase family protein n=1 Tax=Halovivax sp. TaxID=1935978 RepID=UPI0025BEBC8C|nr:inositol monophosphatase [Halovivax sp.]